MNYGTTVVKMIFGSHLYGTSTPESDKDFKGVFLPPLKDLLMMNGARQIASSTSTESSKNTKDDIDIEFFSIHEFLRLASKGDDAAINMLHAPKNMLLECSSMWEDLCKKRSMFYCKDTKAFVGYAKDQAAKYGIKGSRMAALLEVKEAISENWSTYSKLELFIDKLPTNDYCYYHEVDEKRRFYKVLDKNYDVGAPLKNFKISIDSMWNNYGERARLAMNNQGIDWKAISHAMRAAYQAKSIFTEGDIIYPLKERQELIQVKLGQLDFNSYVRPKLEELILEVESLALRSNLPDEVPEEPVNKWLEEQVFNAYGLELSNHVDILGARTMDKLSHAMHVEFQEREK